MIGGLCAPGSRRARSDAPYHKREIFGLVPLLWQNGDSKWSKRDLAYLLLADPHRTLPVHGWIYGLQDGLLRDLDTTVTQPDEVATSYREALSKLS